MQSIQTWYGSEFTDSLMTKGARVEAAKGNETALMVYVGLATGVRERLAAAETNGWPRFNGSMSKQRPGSRL